MTLKISAIIVSELNFDIQWKHDFSASRWSILVQSFLSTCHITLNGCFKTKRTFEDWNGKLLRLAPFEVGEVCSGWIRSLGLMGAELGFCLSIYVRKFAQETISQLGTDGVLLFFWMILDHLSDDLWRRIFKLIRQDVSSSLFTIRLLLLHLRGDPFSSWSCASVNWRSSTLHLEEIALVWVSRNFLLHGKRTVHSRMSMLVSSKF